jgi:outer membrane receptor protein involved in Fe transport
MKPATKLLKAILAIWIAGIVPSLLSGQTTQSTSPTPAEPDAPKSLDDQESQASQDTKGNTIVLDSFVVTGTFERVKKTEATVAITTIDLSEMMKVVPISTADLVKNVPGAFVNSSLGEIRNMVYTRGVSANSTDGASGYYYVSLQEDGLPVTAISANNTGPDFFIRADATLDHLEAVRGGSAAITGANAPGGIFNYISKTGTDVFSGVLSARFGLEGNGSSPYYRSDISVGGPIKNGFYYNVGGFYRHSVGAHDTGYPLNYGGQLKANIVKKFANGSLELYAKMLDDHNGWFEFTPAIGFGTNHFAPGFDNKSSVLAPPESKFSYQTGPNSFATYDVGKLVHSKANVIGLKFDATLGNGWSITNNGKFTNNKYDWNSGAIIFPQPLDNLLTYALLGTLGMPGTYTFTSPSGASAQIMSFSGFDFNRVGNSTLPGSNVIPFAGLIQAAATREMDNKEWMNQFSVTKKFDKGSITAGMFYDHANVLAIQGGAGIGISELKSQPKLLQITLRSPAGQLQQVTNAKGYSAPGAIGQNYNKASWEQIAFFLGNRWEFAPKWSLDWGLRQESVKVGTNNLTDAGNINVTSATGGVDGNVSTLYDNNYVAQGTIIHVERKLSTTSYSAAINRELSKESSIYLRYSVGKKTPDLDSYFSLNNLAANAVAQTKPQIVTQWELGYKFTKPKFSLAVTPFYSDLTDVATGTGFQNPDGTFYNRTVYNALRTYGVEIESTRYFSGGFALRGSLTLQRSTATKWQSWIANGPGAADDALLDFSGNKSDNNPEVMSTITPSYSKGRFFGQIQWRYMGSRPANIPNAFSLPAFSQTDLTLQWQFSHKLTLSLTVNNLLDTKGVMSFAPPGIFLDALNRQGFTKAMLAANPNAPYSIVTIPARAYFLSANYTF